jgi:DNA-binding PadR family transcriptional regulator
VPTRTQSAVARLTTTEAAVLALLAIEGERSGYELQKLVERAIAHVWSPARSGLYAVLPRLAADGLAIARNAPRGRRPERRVYRIAPAGRRALAAWLETVEPGARDAFFLKLFVGGLTTPGVVLRHVLQFRADTEAALARLRAIEPTNTGRGHDWFHRHVLRYGIERLELEAAWAARVQRALERGPR